MGAKRIVAAFGVLVGAGLLAGCCVFSGNPGVRIMASTASARIGETVTFVAEATGGSGSYTYVWVGAIGQGPMGTAVFQSAGEKMAGVTVTDSCGRSSQQAQMYIAVTDDVFDALTGVWEGEMVEPDGDVFEVRLQLFHRGNTLQGNAYHGGRSSIGTGSVIGDQVMFQFPFWFDATRTVVLIGTVGATGNEMKGTWGGTGCPTCTWRVVKI
jgi:hypothetical protein